jgi:predicted permease
MNSLFAWARRRRDSDAEWREEIESHLALREEWNAAHGVEPEDARNLARRQFGNTLATLEEVRAVHINPWIDGVLQDAKYALRGFRKTPSFSIIAIATIAIGIGASTAIFSVVDPLLFRSLPYAQDEQLVSVGYFGPVDDQEFNVVSSYFDWQRAHAPFQALTAMRPSSPCDLMVGETPLRLTCYSAAGNLLGTLGVTPILGSNFTAEDDLPRAPTVVLISYELWRSTFGSDPKVIGRKVSLDEEWVRIIGVLPKDFIMPERGQVDILRPARLDASLPRNANSSSFLRTFARLRSGVSIEQARGLLRRYFDESTRLDVPASLRSEVRMVIRSLRDRQIHDVRLQSWTLMGAAIALLLLACTNVANLLLARASARRNELAMRAAIGASRGRLIRQAFTESLILGALGGAAGCAAAWGLLHVLLRLAPPGTLGLDQARIDVRVLVFALIATLLAALLFGMAPAAERVRSGALASWHTAGATRMLFRKILVAGQVAISLILLTGASLLLRSLWELQNRALGFQTEHVVTASFTPGNRRYQSVAAQIELFRQVEESMRRIPDSGSFALSDTIPPRGGYTRPYSNLRIAGRPPLAENGGLVLCRWVTPGYFQTMGIPIVAGRAFTEEERAAGESPVILSAALAHRIFGDGNPVSQLIELDGNDHWSQIVGVTADATNSGLTEPPGPEYYRLRMRTAPFLPRSVVAVFRTPVDPATFNHWIRRQFAALDPALPVTVQSLDEHLQELRSLPRFMASLVAAFAGIGTLLAAVGLFGVLSFLVSQRTQEIGVRMAVGATPARIALQVQRQAGFWVVAGLIGGLAGSLALTRTMRGLLYGISPVDFVSFAAAVAVLVLVATLATYAPSHRAARIDPAAALRSE